MIDITAILTEEIQREINREIIAELKGERPRMIEPKLPDPGSFAILYDDDGYTVRGDGTLYQEFYRTVWIKLLPFVIDENSEMFWHWFSLKPEGKELIEPWLVKSAEHNAAMEALRNKES